MLSEEWEFFEKSRVSEIGVKRIRVNQGVSVFRFLAKNLSNFVYFLWKSYGHNIDCLFDHFDLSKLK